MTELLANPFALDAIGRTGQEGRFEVTAEAVRAYAEATDDNVPAGRDGCITPPVFAILPVWDTIAPASRSVASDEARRRVVHYEQDMILHRPIEVGMRLISRATPVALLARMNGTSLVIRTETETVEGEPVNTQFVTEFFRGVHADVTRGERPPGHRLDETARAGARLMEIRYPIADDQTARYAAASGDFFEIHLDDDAARAVGLPGRIVHGLCTMAFTGRAVLEAAGVHDPGAIARLAVRFSAPLQPGGTITIRVWALDGGHVFGFEALDSNGQLVIKDGRAELRT
ncbi:MAG: MaoC/PaaZ C-terminal domain-containing protein [Gaiellaceae bacterium]